MLAVSDGKTRPPVSGLWFSLEDVHLLNGDPANVRILRRLQVFRFVAPNLQVQNQESALFAPPLDSVPAHNLRMIPKFFRVHSRPFVVYLSCLYLRKSASICGLDFGFLNEGRFSR